jgi:hypothetical protein
MGSHETAHTPPPGSDAEGRAAGRGLDSDRPCRGAAPSPTRQPTRCGRERPGEPIRLDTRTLGRIGGIGHRNRRRTGQSRRRGRAMRA